MLRRPLGLCLLLAPCALTACGASKTASVRTIAGEPRAFSMLSQPRSAVDALTGNGASIVALANRRKLAPSPVSAASARSAAFVGAPREWVLGAPGSVCLLVEKRNLANKAAGSSIDCGTEQEASAGALLSLTIDAAGHELLQGVLPTGAQGAQVESRGASIPVALYGNLYSVHANYAKELTFWLRGSQRTVPLPPAPHIR
jgi:hypothetical protein